MSSCRGFDKSHRVRGATVKKSIAQLSHIRKVAKIEKAAHAVIVRGSADYWQSINMDNLRGKSDGRIKGLSKNSLSRLRDAIARTAHQSSDYRVYGCCLTIPWGGSRNPSQSDASQIWRLWTHNLGRLLAKLRIGAIYRVELQERKSPHWHLMVYLPNYYNLQDLTKLAVKMCKDYPTSKKRSGKPIFDLGKSWDNVATLHYLALSILRQSWIIANNQYHQQLVTTSAFAALTAHAVGDGVGADIPNIKSFDYCFDCIPLDGVKSGIAYLASHTSKHKQSQLGYIGKQWGYLGSKWLSTPSTADLLTPNQLSHQERARAYRLIRRWIKRNRTLTDWRVCRPRRISFDGGDVYKGLVIRNTGTLYLFGVPPDIVSRAFDCSRL